MYQVSDRFKAAAISPDHRAVNKVELWNANTLLPVDLGKTVWTVNFDETAQIRRSGTVVIPSKGRTKDDLVPVSTKDVLHPATGNELRIFRGFRFDDDSEEYAPLGVFRLSKPLAPNVGQGVNISITVNDRSSLISAISWQTAFLVAAGTDLASAFFAVMNSRYPGLTYALVPTNPLEPLGQNITTPAVAFGTALSGSNDPYADALSLVTNAGGLEALFDVIGQVVLRIISDPATAPIVANFIKGSATPWLLIERDMDETVEFNGVIVIGNGTGGPPVQASVWDTNPDSPTYYLGKWGQRPKIITSALFPVAGQTTINAQAQAMQIAQSTFQLVMRAMDATSASIIANPALQEGDCVYLNDPDTGIDGNYAISKGSITSDVSQMMTIGCRPQRFTE